MDNIITVINIFVSDKSLTGASLIGPAIVFISWARLVQSNLETTFSAYFDATDKLQWAAPSATAAAVTLFSFCGRWSIQSRSLRQTGKCVADDHVDSSCQAAVSPFIWQRFYWSLIPLPTSVSVRATAALSAQCHPVIKQEKAHFLTTVARWWWWWWWTCTFGLSKRMLLPLQPPESSQANFSSFLVTLSSVEQEVELNFRSRSILNWIEFLSFSVFKVPNLNVQCVQLPNAKSQPGSEWVL